MRTLIYLFYLRICNIMKKLFKINSKYSPAGDQPKAIEQLVDGLEARYGFTDIARDYGFG